MNEVEELGTGFGGGPGFPVNASLRGSQHRRDRRTDVRRAGTRSCQIVCHRMIKVTSFSSLLTCFPPHTQRWGTQTVPLACDPGKPRARRSLSAGAGLGIVGSEAYIIWEESSLEEKCEITKDKVRA